MSYEQIAGPIITNIQPQPLSPELAALKAIIDSLRNHHSLDFPDARRLLDAMTADELAYLGVAADALRSLTYSAYWNRTTGTYELARSEDT